MGCGTLSIDAEPGMDITLPPAVVVPGKGHGDECPYLGYGL